MFFCLFPPTFFHSSSLSGMICRKVVAFRKIFIKMVEFPLVSFERGSHGGETRPPSNHHARVRGGQTFQNIAALSRDGASGLKMLSLKLCPFNRLLLDTIDAFRWFEVKQIEESRHNIRTMRKLVPQLTPRRDGFRPAYNQWIAKCRRHVCFACIA